MRCWRSSRSGDERESRSIQARFQFSENLVDRKLADSYEIDRKMGLLVTMASLLLTGLIVAGGIYPELGPLDIVLIAASASASIASIICCTYFLVSQTGTDRATRESLRTIRGIAALEPAVFTKDVMKASIERLTRENLDQIYKVNRIILRKLKVARRAVVLFQLSGALALALIVARVWRAVLA